jgi:parvulin-like peptidyl-prolyl isomerase
MNMLKASFLAAVAAVLTGGPVPMAAASPTNSANQTTASDAVVARGKGFEIRRREMDQVLATAQAQHPQTEIPPDAEVQVLNQLIEIQLVLQGATEEEKLAGRRQAEKKFAYISKTLSATELENRLAATHMTADDLLRKFAQDDAAQRSLARQLGIQVTDADAQKWFDDHPGAYDQPPMAHVRELLLLTTSDFTTSAAPPLPAATIEAKHQLIFNLYQRVRGGEDFAVLAKQYNEDPITKETGGEVTFRRNQMGYSDLAFAMQPKQMSGVITNEDGFLIFQLLEIIPAKKADFAALKDQLKNMLVGVQKRNLAPGYLKQLRQAAAVEILDAGLKAKVAEAEAAAAQAAKTQAEFEAKQAAQATNMLSARP